MIFPPATTEWNFVSENCLCREESTRPSATGESPSTADKSTKAGDSTAEPSPTAESMPSATGNSMNAT